MPGKTPEYSLDDAQSRPATGLDPQRKLITAASSLMFGLEFFTLTNSAVRVALTGYVAVATRSPELAGLTMAGSTFAYEWLGSLAASWLLGTGGGNRAAETANRAVQRAVSRVSRNRIGISRMRAIPPVAAAAISMTLGPPTLLVLEQAANPNRTLAENVHRGTAWSVGVSAALGVETFLATAGIAELNAATGVIALGGLVSAYTLAKKGMQQLRVQTAVHAEPFNPAITDDLHLPDDAAS